MKTEEDSLQIIVENDQNLNTGGDIVGSKLRKGINPTPKVLSLSEKNYTLKFLGERIINPFKFKEVTNKLGKSRINMFNYYFDIASMILLMISFLRKNKNIVIFHTFFKKGKLLIDFVYFFKKIVLTNFSVILSDKIIFLTNAQKEHFRKYSIFKQKFLRKSIVVGNGIEENTILVKKNPLDGIKAIYVGRFTSQKGIDLVLSVSKEKELMDSLIVIGKGNKKVEGYFRSSKRVSYTKEVENDKLSNYYDKSNLLILPSYSEVFPLVVLEAMARGLVILASDIPGMREIVKNGVNGYLFTKGDLDDLKEKLLYLKKNPKEIERISKNNLKDVRKFILKNQIDRYTEIVENIKKDD